jgi:hypothetical protein
VIQSITIRDDLFADYRKGTDFIQQYVFPGGMLPSRSGLPRAAARQGLAVRNEYAFGLDYARTLAEWRLAFEARWPEIAALGFDETFRRLWRMYLCYCEAGFLAGNIDVVQFELASSLISAAGARRMLRLASAPRRCCLAGLARPGRVSQPGAALTRPPAWRWGSGEFRRFGFLVYEATLWAGDDPLRPPLALKLTYKRNIERPRRHCRGQRQGNPQARHRRRSHGSALGASRWQPSSPTSSPATASSAASFRAEGAQFIFNDRSSGGRRPGLRPRLFRHLARCRRTSAPTCAPRCSSARTPEADDHRPHPAYGLLGLPLAFAALPVYVHVPRFYAETAGMSNWRCSAAILLGTRLLDAGIDPWLGWLADRVSRRRMVAVALAALRHRLRRPAQPAGDSGRRWWLLGSLALTYLGFSAASVAYQAWGADVGADSPAAHPADRRPRRLRPARRRPRRRPAGLLASDLGEGIARLSLGAAAAAADRGRHHLQPGRRRAAGHRDGQPAAAAQPAPGHRRCRLPPLLGVFVANGIAAALPATLFLFFVADVLQLTEMASGPLLALYFVAGAASLPLWVKLAARYGRVRAWLGGDVAVDHRLRRRQPARQRRPLAVRRHLHRFRPGARRRPGAARRHGRRPRRAPGAGRRLLRRLELRCQTQPGAGRRAGAAAARLLGYVPAAARAGALTLRLRPAAARLQGAGRPAALALAPFPGDLT